MGHENDERLREHGFMAQALIPMVAVVLFGGGLSLFSNDRPGVRDQIAFNQRFGGDSAVVELTPAGYETLRDMVVVNPSIAPAVAKAMSDDRVDTLEMRRIVGNQRNDPAPTELDTAHARGDLAATVNAYTHGNVR